MVNKIQLQKMALTALVVCLLAPASYSQSLRIVYDFLKDEITYYETKPGDKIGKEISSPIVGRNKIVQVEVVNFNKFVFTANSTFTSRMVADQSDMSLMSIITPLVMPAGSGSFFTSLGGNLPDDVPRGGLLSNRDAADAFDDYRTAFENLNNLQNSFANMDYAIKKLNYLRYNPYLPTDSIVAMSDKLIQMIFNKPNVTPSDFTNAAITLNSDYHRAFSNFKSSTVKFLTAYSNYAADHAGENFEGEGLDLIIKQLANTAEDQDITANLNYITNRIDILETIYTSIKSTSFSFNSSHAAQDDEIELVLSFYKNPASVDSFYPSSGNLQNLDGLNKIKEKKIKIVVRGDMKMTTSVGLGFPRFSNVDTYFNKDSIITSQTGSNYTPNLSAYVNFYPYTGRVVNLGGTFGIGVPLNDPNKNVNMFLGGAALFGSHDRVALHGGVTLGQLKRLNEGYKPGEKLLSATQEVPLRSVWDWGGFVGISFTLNKGSGNN